MSLLSFMTSCLYPNARILIVDDNPVNVELLTFTLEEYGYTHLTGLTDSREVADQLTFERFDLILLDIRMPHLDGHQILTWLRAEWGTQAPPVIVLSAQIDRASRLEALNLGARDFLGKPFDRQEVLQRIHNTLEVHFLLQERNSQAAMLQRLVEERTLEIRLLSFQDPITHLPNRLALLTEILPQQLENQHLTLFNMAISGLTDIARLHGHGLTEQISLQLRDRLQKYFSDAVLLGIWKDTKWLIGFANLPHEGLEDRVRKVMSCIQKPFCIDYLHLQISARVGVSHSNMAYQSAEHLVRMAAMALPEKDGLWRIYHHKIEEELQRKTRYRQALHDALDNHQMFLVYQPKVDLETERVIGAEALLRWIHPELGFISPVEFIPLAESSGEILRLGDWVLDQSIQQLETWINTGAVHADFRIAVNVAPLQLMQPNFSSKLLDRLKKSTLPAGAIEVEVTESGLMSSLEIARHQLQSLAHQGFSTAIDDFGTGYSSLSYLKSLPLSVLKIDRAFVNDMDQNPQDRCLVETVIQMARNFGFTTVAEGIERPEHVSLLQELGCHVGQGYWYSPPLKPDAFLDFYQQRAN